MSHRKDRSDEGTALADDRPQRPSDATAPVPPARTRAHASNTYAVSVICGLILLTVALVFGKTLAYDFVNYDDDLFVSDNPMVTRGITVQSLVWACTTHDLEMWFPLTLISYMSDSQMCGLEPWGYHLTNVVLHAATAVILFLALRQMTANLWASALIALLFAIHPLRVETVAWVAERKGGLSGLFFVSTIAAHVAYARRPFSLLRYLAVAGLFTLGLSAKPQLVTLPFVLLLLDYWPLGRWQGAGSRRGVCAAGTGAGSADNAFAAKSPWQLVVEKIPLLLLAFAASVAGVWGHGNVARLTSVPMPARIANALISYAVYLGQFFWPVGLAPFYPYSRDLPAWQVGGAVLVLAAVSLAALMSWRKQPALLVGWLWYLGTFVPMIGLVPIGEHVRADRYTYLPQIGLIITVVWAVRWGVEQLWGDWPPRCWLYGVGGTLLVVAFMACAWRQTSYWRNGERLWTHALACTSNNHVAHLGLGDALASRGQIDEAIAQYRMALDIKPDYFLAHHDLAFALTGRGQIDEAIAQYRMALDIKPDYFSAHNDLGLALAGRGQIDEAIAHFRKALDIKPDYTEAHNNLGVALASRKRIDEAIVHFRKTLEIDPGFVKAHNNLGIALADREQPTEAIYHYRQALAIKPDYAEAHYNLGLALAGLGRVNEAVAHYQTALEMARQQGNVALAETIRAKIGPNGARKPIREAP